MRYIKSIVMVLILGLMTHGGVVCAQESDFPDDITPPRLSFVSGQVSFWRYGTPDWSEAQLNTPLTPGDQLYSGGKSNLELQIGAFDFFRAGANSQIGLENQKPDYIQFKITSGHVSFDINSTDSGRIIEVDAPNAAFTINLPGYYRVDVDGEHSALTARRSGQAIATPVNGEATQVMSGEEVTLDGTTTPQIDFYRAPELDKWDLWCLARSDWARNAVSARYVSPDVYGASDLDSAGEWQNNPTYGNIWIPREVPSGWAPYTTGSWINDPYYGWTWVDSQPWGWAPYHYGRWISLGRRWAWAPGPPLTRPAYAPALVAFLGSDGRVVDGIGGPALAWVALGWGEPCVPWWRPERHRRPWWGGWGGPRSREFERTGTYQNIKVNNAVTVVNVNNFSKGPVRSHHISGIQRDLRPLTAGPAISNTQAAVLPSARQGIRPPEDVIQRPVVATRPFHNMSAIKGERNAAPAGPAGRAMPAPQIVAAPAQPKPGASIQRPPSPEGKVERPESSRVIPPLPAGHERNVHGPGHKPDTNESQRQQESVIPQSQDRPTQPPPLPIHKGEGTRIEPPQVGGSGPPVQQPARQDMKTFQQKPGETHDRQIETQQQQKIQQQQEQQRVQQQQEQEQIKVQQQQQMEQQKAQQQQEQRTKLQQELQKVQQQQQMEQQKAQQQQEQQMQRQQQQQQQQEQQQMRDFCQKNPNAPQCKK